MKSLCRGTDRFPGRKEVCSLDEYPFTILDIAALLNLPIRRELADSVYVDCPFCQKRKGKMNLNFRKNIWRCNRCGEGGHMFQLYARMRNLSVSEAKLELIDRLCDDAGVEPTQTTRAKPVKSEKAPVELSPPASPEEIDKTMRALFELLTLTEAHRKHLQEKRGLTDEQIAYLGLKSTASYKLCYYIPQKLSAQGYQIEGVPGFYIGKNGRWMVNFGTRTAGILIPVRSVDGLIRGAQIRLDVPFKDDADDPEDEGTKYIWFSSSSKHKGASSGSPVNFIGDPHSRVVYVTEGCLKAGIAHCLMGRAFLSIQGANNLSGLKDAFIQLYRNGTEEIIEAHDTDKFCNDAVALGAAKIHLLAKECGMTCRPLTWNPNYKGVDDWQLALRRKAAKKEGDKLNFKEQHLSGRCEFAQIQDYVEAWHDGAGLGEPLDGFLGLNASEYAAYCHSGQKLQALLDGQRRTQNFRIYQLDFSDGRTKPFAFQDIEVLHKEGYQQPPAAEYCLVHEGRMTAPAAYTEFELLRRVFEEFNDDLPAGYHGRSVAPSDVIELFDSDGRRYYYRNRENFTKVRFSPALAHSLLKGQAGDGNG